MRLDKELSEYRDLMTRPTEFEDGFNLKSILGGLFIGFIMIPGAIYLGLVAGVSLGSAAEWVTIILFAEVARRSFTVLKRQELYVLFYIASGLTGMIGGLALTGGEFANAIWNQYLRQSQAMKGLGIADKIPTWVVPPANSEAILHRTFFHHDWLLPICLLVVGAALAKLNSFGLGYTLFRITSDFEQLPFPMAPISAQGATALAEITTKEETWRWRVFSIGSMIGLCFGLFYVGIPTLTGAVLSQPLQLIPIPFIDMTHTTESLLPATPTGISTDIGLLMAGFVVPFYAVVGSFAAALSTMILNPILKGHGILHTWRPGMDTIQTSMANQVDFYLSLGIGVSVAVAVIGLISVTIGLLRKAKEERNKEGNERSGFAPPPGRGDIPLWLALTLWIFSTSCYVLLCRWLVPNFPVYFILFFGFIFTPLNSYINARMNAITGQWVGIPMVLEGTLILSKYKGVDIWFAPLPIQNYGGMAQHFRVVELTGTKITSIIKADIFMFFLMLFCSALFWTFIWKLAPIPSNAYPYAQKMWHLAAFQRGLWMTATLEGRSFFMQALNPIIMAAGFLFATVGYLILYAFGLPVMLIYGFIQGLGTLPHGAFPFLLGALLGRYYFSKRFGLTQWRQYAPVLAAGFACGMGLIGMGCAAIAMIAKSVSQMPF